jgi:hypothetical protein
MPLFQRNFVWLLLITNCSNKTIFSLQASKFVEIEAMFISLSNTRWRGTTVKLFKKALKTQINFITGQKKLSLLNSAQKFALPKKNPITATV